MKENEFEDDLVGAGREPISRKRSKTIAYEDEDYVQRKQKKSGKRFHRKPTPRDDFGEK